MNKVLMFDFDGVISDSYGHYLDVFLEACQAHGFLQIHDSASFLSLFDDNLYESAANAGISKEDFNAVLKTMEDKLAATDSNHTVFREMPEVLYELSLKFPLYVVTSNRSELVEAFLLESGIDYFQGVFGGDFDTCKVRKIEGVMQQYETGEFYFVGDTCGDIKEGYRAGVNTVGVSWGYHGAERLKSVSPHFLVQSPHELLSLFDVSPNGGKWDLA